MAGIAILVSSESLTILQVLLSLKLFWEILSPWRGVNNLQINILHQETNE
jgi:hypothetical protein